MHRPTVNFNPVFFINYVNFITIEYSTIPDHYHAMVVETPSKFS